MRLALAVEDAPCHSVLESDYLADPSPAARSGTAGNVHIFFNQGTRDSALAASLARHAAS